MTSSAKRPRAAIEAAATNPAIAAAIRSAATVEASATAMKTAASSTIETAASAMRTAASASAAAVTAASVLSECGICCECKADDSSKCDERSAKTEGAHSLYLPSRTWERTFERLACWEKDGPLLYEILPLGTRLRGC